MHTYEENLKELKKLFETSIGMIDDILYGFENIENLQDKDILSLSNKQDALAAIIKTIGVL